METLYDKIQLQIIHKRMEKYLPVSKVVPDQEEVEKDLELNHPEIHIHGINLLLQA